LQYGEIAGRTAIFAWSSPESARYTDPNQMRTIAAVAFCLGLAWGAEDPFAAIRENRLAALDGAGVAARDRRDNTPLIYAAAFGSVDAVRRLVERGADVNARNAFGATALVYAAGNEAKVRVLLAHGADVNARTRQGRTPLMIAAACDGCSAVVSLLLEKGADAKAKDTGGSTALELAASAGDSASVRLLLAAGADARSVSQSGMTPLAGAVFNCDLPSVRALLAKGADPNAAVTDAGTVKFGKIQLIGMTPMLNSTAYCRGDVAQALIDAHGDVNAHDIRGMTPLMLAVASETQDAALVRILVHAGAEVNAKSGVGETALDWAAKYGDGDVASILKAEGAHRATPPDVPYQSRDRKGAVREDRGSSVPLPYGRGSESGARDARSVRGAVETATALLQRSSTEFFRQSGCVGCHHQSLTLAALNAARAGGAKVDEGTAGELAKEIVAEFAGGVWNRMQRFDPGGLGDGQSYSMLALAGAGHARDEVTDAIAIHTAALQHADGRWHVGDASRSPIQESEIARTARAMRVLQLYGPPAMKTEFDARIGRGREWLAAAHAKTTDDLAMQMVGLHWAGTLAAALGRELLAAQRSDGGWAQNRNLASDAFATGEALWALREAGVLKPADAAYRRGVEFLLAAQWPDGSWYVRSRAPKFQPYFQSGFPFGHDQWVSSAGTAWAVMALAPAIPNEKR
jgi:ankyrin repeat protein